MCEYLSSVVQTSEPYNKSEKKGGTVEHNYRVDLGCETEGADIYYTTDGSLPGPHHYTTKVGHKFLSFFL